MHGREDSGPIAGLFLAFQYPLDALLSGVCSNKRTMTRSAWASKHWRDLPGKTKKERESKPVSHLSGT
jgi:hypothetical protein